MRLLQRDPTLGDRTTPMRRPPMFEKTHGLGGYVAVTHEYDCDSSKFDDTSLVQVTNHTQRIGLRHCRYLDDRR